MSRVLLFSMILLLPVFGFTDGERNRGDFLRHSQIGLLEGDVFAREGLTGKGIRIAVLDGGFPGVNTHPAFKHLNNGGRIVATWDFIRDRENVFRGNSHGTEVLACIAGILDSEPMGLAPDAEFLLALVEEAGEPASEEVRWAKAVEWAIDNGARIIQSSLGYTYHRYFREELDGRHSVVAKAALRAAREGVLIVNCAGNEGTSRWRTLVTPADSDSILTVGAIDPDSNLAAAFSSVGPTADGRIKPDVCASGTVVTVNHKGGRKTASGTSFSSPLVTGFAACTWQRYPEKSAMEIIGLIRRSGHLFPYYDYSHGYGIPKASGILDTVAISRNEPVNISSTEDKFTIELPSPIGANSVVSPRYLCYHMADAAGYLHRYGVIRVNDTVSTVQITRDSMPRAGFFRCSFLGKVTEWKEGL